MGHQRTTPGAWGILLAGGDGTRLQALTARIEGDTCPKQFSRILGDESLLAQTRRRISPLFDDDKVVAIVTEKHRRFYSREFHGSAQGAAIVQPENRGTAVAIAAAVLTLRDVDPEAIVATFPCDHHYSDEAGFLSVMEAGLFAARDVPDAIVIIGAEATHAETEYGWIEPTRKFAKDSHLASSRVRQFWEKPTLATAIGLQRRGCLWNTFVTMARVGTLIEILYQVAPDTIRALSSGIRQNDLDSAYQSIPSMDFSRDVLAVQPERLLVIRDAVSGWTDLGNPERVFEALARNRIAPAWLESMAGFPDFCGEFSPKPNPGQMG
jgi:mannose-1-phosphate guanylyltransferase